MDVLQAAQARRSVRSFKQDPIPWEALEGMVDAARVGPAAANRQPLEYVVVTDPGLCAEVFSALKWAAYIAPKGDPQPGHEPTAYIVVLKRAEYMLEAMVGYDVGAAVAAILLAAAGQGVGTCWLKSINYPKVSKALNVAEGYEVDSVIAMGYPDEEPKLVNLEQGKDGLEVIKYWRDDSGQHFVPKRALADVLHKDRQG